MSMISPEATKKYIQRRADDVAACKAALEAKDYSVMENIGHKLKGNGLTFGYPELAELGKDLELAAVNKDFDSSEVLVTKFAAWYDEKKNFEVPEQNAQV